MQGRFSNAQEIFPKADQVGVSRWTSQMDSANEHAHRRVLVEGLPEACSKESTQRNHLFDRIAFEVPKCHLAVKSAPEII